MLRRFEQIKNNGIFENFRWSTNVHDFERINLIYGTNGAGKTSLSRALDALDKESCGFVDVSIRMSDAGGAKERATDQTHDSEFERVFVFSEGYVARSHNFEGHAEIDAVLTLGERTVEDEKRIAELGDLIGEAETSLVKTATGAHAADRALNDEYTVVSRSVVMALSRAGGEYRSNGTYSKGTVKKKFLASRTGWAKLSEKDKDASLATVASEERQIVPTRTFSLSVSSQLVYQATETLASSPVSIVLDTLKRHDEASTWVENGRHLHKEIETCIFCGGKLTDERMQKIEEHFSDEVEAVQRIVDSLIDEVKALQSSSKSLLGDTAISGALYDDLRESFRTEHALAKLQVDELTKWLKGLLGALEKKRANVVSPVAYEMLAPPAVDGSKLESTLSEHNDRVKIHGELVHEAAKKIELHMLKDAEEKIEALSQATKDTAAEKASLEDTLREYRAEIASLENIEGDPLPSAEVMARELSRILGRNELSFELLPDGKRYRVTRHGTPARDLSTGERTAITLIHFLEHVKTASTRLGKAIVIVDDPVSSLDNGASMGISTYIWSEAISKKHIEQIFLLTHNFDLFRQWDIQIEGLGGKRGPDNNKGFSSNCYELIAPYQTVGSIIKRVPAFVKWPPSDQTRTKVRSSYHHAFIVAVRANAELATDSSMERKLDALLLYPNVLRRILETFLAFKVPDLVGNFTNSMRVIGAGLEELGYEGDADALRLQLTRFTHAYSHAESPETDVAPSPEEIGAIIKAVFTFMHVIDPQHFEGLCKVVGVDPPDLLIESYRVADTALED